MGRQNMDGTEKATRGRVMHAYSRTCAWCGKRIEPGDMELHHWLIKRGMLPKRAYGSINVVINVVPLHRWCHMDYGQTREMKDKCFSLVSSVFGEEAIRKFEEGVWKNESS